ncbi:MAG: serine protease [Pseudomonadota bacterium]
MIRHSKTILGLSVATALLLPIPAWSQDTGSQAARDAAARTLEERGRQQVGLRRHTDGPRSTPRVVGGTDALIGGRYEFTVQLTLSGRYRCGGSLVSPVVSTASDGTRFLDYWVEETKDNLWVVTAAHCLYDDLGNLLAPADIEVRAGSRDADAGRILPVADNGVHPHPDYVHGARPILGDIALLKLKPVPSAASTEPFWSIAVSGSIDAGVVYQEGAAHRVNGWGQTQEGGVLANFMQTAMIPYGDQARCVDSYAIHGLRIARDQYCAGWTTGGIDSCGGDSGGSVFMLHPRHSASPILAGVVSWGKGCARPELLGVYTSVLQRSDWLSDVIVRNL